MGNALSSCFTQKTPQTQQQEPEDNQFSLGGNVLQPSMTVIRVYDPVKQSWTYEYIHNAPWNGAGANDWDAWGGNDNGASVCSGDGGASVCSGDGDGDEAVLGGAGAVWGGNVCWDAWGGSVYGDNGASVCSGDGGASVCSGDGDGDGGDGDGGAVLDGGDTGVGLGAVDAFSAVGALGDTGGGAGTNAVGADAQWDGLELKCQPVNGKLPIPFKASIRKELGRRNDLTNPLLKAIGSMYLNGDNKDILLNAWHNPTTPHVLKCLIADIFHKHKREKDLGPLPTYYILPYTQKKGKRNGKKRREYVDCVICQNRRGNCSCCTSCHNRNGECTCRKQCTVNQHKCCICTGCCNNLCNCTCPHP